MRLNLPVTSQAFAFPSESTLLSTTDLKGRIAYANAAFVAVSGFGRSELIGQPHNLVRHPDMPPQAFEDMWRTLRAGDSWSALVKNRRKNGDYYWVRANATPVREGNAVVGYMSVRTRASDSEIQTAERLYRKLRDESPKRLALDRGALVRKGWLRWSSWLTTLPLRWRLGAVVSAMAVTTIVVSELLPLVLSGVSGEAHWLGVVFSSVLGAWLLELDLVRPLAEIKAHATAVASGRCESERRLHRVDEIGMIMRGVNQAGLNMRALIDDIGQQVDGVRTACREISAGNNDLSARTEHTASNLQQTAATMEQISAAVAANAESSRQASLLAETVRHSAQKSGAQVERVAQAIEEINEASKRVAAISAAIDGIAFQTNVLALNAAVEAARAGEVGRGFAVVAGEVRSLSVRSAAAAREISALVERSVAAAQAGVNEVLGARQSMAELVVQASNITGFIAEVATATVQQSSGIGQVSAAVVQLEQLAQRNAALVEETAAASAALLERADRIADAAQVFRR